ncbi:MAG: BatD family protein [Lutibacter sp.]|nr:BatD family protein [Lutibacter sp.]
MPLAKIHIIILWCLLSVAMTAQVRFETKVSKHKLGVNQRFRIEFSINKQGADDFTPPSFSGFKVVGGPSSSVNQSWINGKSAYSQSYTFVLQPLKEGRFTIGAASIDYEGKKLRSNTVQLTVTKAVEIPKDPNNPQYIAQQNIHLVAEVSNRRPYVGEGIYVVYKLYVSENISVHDWRITDSPQYKGFWNQDIEVKEIQVKRGSYNGEDYKYVVLKRAVLIPQRAGKLSIEQIKMDFSVGIPTGRGDFFGNMITRNINYSAQSALKNIQVQALPAAGKPLNFSGAVGDFDFRVIANKQRLKANDAAQVQVVVSGKGNLKLFEIPTITTPPELEVYTPEHKERVKTTLRGLQGQISDSYTVVPQYAGKYQIPELVFSYFNPKEKQYRTITTDPLFMEVSDGNAVVASAGEPTANVSKRTVSRSDNNFRFISLNSVFELKKNPPFFKTMLFYLLLLLPFLAIPLGIYLGNKRAARAGDVFGNRIRLADKLARKYLSEAKKQLGKKEAFYIALEKALHHFLKAKLQVETAEISKERISELLIARGTDQATVDAFIQVLKDCDFGRYTPTTNVMMVQEYEKAKALITQLEKQL